MTFQPHSMEFAAAPGRWDDDRRGEMRATMTFAYGKLAVSGSEQVCQIRDISPRGVSIEARHMPLEGQRAWIEMRGLASTPGVVVWRDGSRGGLAFEAEQDLRGVLDARRGMLFGKARAPRFALQLPVQLTCARETARLELVDISMGGMKLSGTTGLDIGTCVAAKLEGAAESYWGYIRWKQDGTLGFAFDRTISRDELFNLLRLRG